MSVVCAEGLRRVALTLPPPARLDGGLRGELPQTTQQALGRLLQACGLETEFAGVQEAAACGAAPSTPALLHFESPSCLLSNTAYLPAVRSQTKLPKHP